MGPRLFDRTAEHAFAHLRELGHGTCCGPSARQANRGQCPITPLLTGQGLFPPQTEGRGYAQYLRRRGIVRGPRGSWRPHECLVSELAEKIEDRRRKTLVKCWSKRLKVSCCEHGIDERSPKTTKPGMYLKNT